MGRSKKPEAAALAAAQQKLPLSSRPLRRTGHAPDQPAPETAPAAAGIVTRAGLGSSKATASLFDVSEKTPLSALEERMSKICADLTAGEPALKKDLAGLASGAFLSVLCSRRVVESASADLRLNAACVAADVLESLAPEEPDVDEREMTSLFKLLLDQLLHLRNSSENLFFDRAFYMLEKLASTKSLNIAASMAGVQSLVMQVFRAAFDCARTSGGALTSKVEQYLVDVLLSLLEHVRDHSFLLESLLFSLMQHLLSSEQRKAGSKLPARMAAKILAGCSETIQSFASKLVSDAVMYRRTTSVATRVSAADKKKEKKNTVAKEKAIGSSNSSKKAKSGAAAKGRRQHATSGGGNRSEKSANGYADDDTLSTEGEEEEEGDMHVPVMAVLSRKDLFELLYECSLISTNLLLYSLPTVGMSLSSEDVEERKDSVTVLARLFFAERSRAFVEYDSVYRALLSRFVDINSEIRVLMVHFAKVMVLHHPSTAPALCEYLDDRLADHEDGVRRAAVNTLCEIAEQNLELVAKPVLANVAHRGFDKNSRIRVHTFERLGKLYMVYLRRLSKSEISPPNRAKLEWIPVRILSLMNLSSVEHHFLAERLLATILGHAAAVEERALFLLQMSSSMDAAGMAALTAMLVAKNKYRLLLKRLVDLREEGVMFARAEGNPIMTVCESVLRDFESAPPPMAAEASTAMLRLIDVLADGAARKHLAVIVNPMGTHADIASSESKLMDIFAAPRPAAPASAPFASALSSGRVSAEVATAFQSILRRASFSIFSIEVACEIGAAVRSSFEVSKTATHGTGVTAALTMATTAREAPGSGLSTILSPGRQEVQICFAGLRLLGAAFAKVFPAEAQACLARLAPVLLDCTDDDVTTSLLQVFSLSAEGLSVKAPKLFGQIRKHLEIMCMTRDYPIARLAAKTAIKCIVDAGVADASLSAAVASQSQSQSQSMSGFPKPSLSVASSGSDWILGVCNRMIGAMKAGPLLTSHLAFLYQVAKRMPATFDLIADEVILKSQRLVLDISTVSSKGGSVSEDRPSMQCAARVFVMKIFSCLAIVNPDEYLPVATKLLLPCLGRLEDEGLRQRMPLRAPVDQRTLARAAAKCMLRIAVKKDLDAKTFHLLACAFMDIDSLAPFLFKMLSRFVLGIRYTALLALSVSYEKHYELLCSIFHRFRAFVEARNISIDNPLAVNYYPVYMLPSFLHALAHLVPLDAHVVGVLTTCLNALRTAAAVGDMQRDQQDDFLASLLHRLKMYDDALDPDSDDVRAMVDACFLILQSQHRLRANSHYSGPLLVTSNMFVRSATSVAKAARSYLPPGFTVGEGKHKVVTTDAAGTYPQSANSARESTDAHANPKVPAKQPAPAEAAAGVAMGREGRSADLHDAGVKRSIASSPMKRDSRAAGGGHADDNTTDSGAPGSTARASPLKRGRSERSASRSSAADAKSRRSRPKRRRQGRRPSTSSEEEGEEIESEDAAETDEDEQHVSASDSDASPGGNGSLTRPRSAKAHDRSDATGTRVMDVDHGANLRRSARLQATCM